MQEVVFLVATHEQAHALQIIEAAHVPLNYPVDDLTCQIAV